MFCSRCGKKVLEYMLFCPFCGTEIVIPDQDEAVPAPAPQDETPQEIADDAISPVETADASSGEASEDRPALDGPAEVPYIEQDPGKPRHARRTKPAVCADDEVTDDPSGAAPEGPGEEPIPSANGNVRQARRDGPAPVRAAQMRAVELRKRVPEEEALFVDASERGPEAALSFEAPDDRGSESARPVKTRREQEPVSFSADHGEEIDREDEDAFDRADGHEEEAVPEEADEPDDVPAPEIDREMDDDTEPLTDRDTEDDLEMEDGPAPVRVKGNPAARKRAKPMRPGPARAPQSGWFEDEPKRPQRPAERRPRPQEDGDRASGRRPYAGPKRPEQQGRRPDARRAQAAKAPQPGRRGTDTLVPEKPLKPKDIFMDDIVGDEDYDAYDAFDDSYEAAIRARGDRGRRYEDDLDDDFDDLDDLDDLDEDDLDDDESLGGSFLMRHVRSIVGIILFVALVLVLVLYFLSDSGQTSLAHINATLPLRAEIYARLGKESYEAKDYQQAGVYFSRALAREPNSYDWASSAAMSYVSGGETEKAAEMLKKTIELNPQRSEPYYLLINLYPDVSSRPWEITQLIRKGYQATGDERLNVAG